MKPAKPFKPSVQAARYRTGNPKANHNPVFTMNSLAHPVSRVDTRPTIETPWGHTTGMGLYEDRLAVQPSSLMKPDTKALMCAGAGFLAFSLLGGLGR